MFRLLFWNFCPHVTPLTHLPTVFLCQLIMESLHVIIVGFRPNVKFSSKKMRNSIHCSHVTFGVGFMKINSWWRPFSSRCVTAEEDGAMCSVSPLRSEHSLCLRRQFSTFQCKWTISGRRCFRCTLSTRQLFHLLQVEQLEGFWMKNRKTQQLFSAFVLLPVFSCCSDLVWF